MTNEIGIHKILLMTNCPYLGFRLGMKTDRRMDGRTKHEDTQYHTLKFKHEIYITILFHCKIKIKQLAGKSGEHREKKNMKLFRFEKKTCQTRFVSGTKATYSPSIWHHNSQIFELLTVCPCVCMSLFLTIY